jgi:CubicO group peptidase (beta-lactamase class C family)
MSLEDLGNVGEFVAAVGVVISLIYLAIQIRQNTAHLAHNTKTGLALAAVAGLAFPLAFACAVVHLPEDRLDASLLAGQKAGLACSAVFLAKRPLASVVGEELRGLGPEADALPDPVVDETARSVSVRYAAQGAPRVAVYREGWGCTTLPPGAAPGDLPALRAPARPAPADTASAPWPDGDLLPGDALPPEIDRERLERAVAAAFDGDTYGEGTVTIGVAVVYGGALVAERYRPGFGPHTPSRSWSVAKSITNALVGMLVDEGRLRVDAPAPIPEWPPGDPRARITLQQLLHMSSGLERAGAASYAAYFGGADTVAEITRAPLEVEPGTRWFYANRDTLLLVRSMRQAIGDDARYRALPASLFDRLGMRSTTAEIDLHGNFVLSSQVFTTARDLARFGLLYLQDGVFGGERILPEGWVEFTRRPAPARRRGLPALFAYGLSGLAGYGAQFWLLGSLPRVPDDAFAALGSRGQAMAVVPSRRLVVVRTGLDSEPAGVFWRHDRFVADVVRALR